MARTKQTARKSTGGKAPRAALISRVFEGKGKGKGGMPIMTGGKGGKGGAPRMDRARSRSRSRSPDATATAAAAPVEEPKQIVYDVSHESSFFAHHFALGPRPATDFEPRFFSHNSVSPLAPAGSAPELFLGLGFRSRFDGVAGKQAERPPLDLVVCIDISGSMGIPFTNSDGSIAPGAARKTKLQVARDALASLGAQLRDDDRLGLVAFNHIAARVLPVAAWNSERMLAAVAALRAGGGTNVSAAFNEAAAMLDGLGESRAGGRSSRILLLTDMEVGEQDASSFLAGVSSCSQRTIWSTVVGVGLDLCSDVIATVSKTPGCGYCNVRSSEGFAELAAAEFAFWVNPIAFNIRFELVSEDVSLAEGFGTPEVRGAIAPGTAVHFSTEFPSSENSKGETRAGFVVFRLFTKRPLVAGTPLRAVALAKWEDANGLPKECQQEIVFGSEGSSECLSLRKAVTLVRYTSFMREYIDKRGTENEAELPRFLELRKAYPLLATHFAAEMRAVDDVTLDTEMHLLQEIAKEDDIPLNIGDGDAPAAKKQKAGEETEQPSAPAPAPASTVAVALRVNDGALAALKRRAVQEIAKTFGIAASGKTEEIVAKLKDRLPAVVDASAGLCCVCMAQQKTVLLFPCKHLCVCKACSAALSACPICRAAITEKTEIFL